MALDAENREYLKPEVLAQIGDLGLRARGVVEGFVSGLHRSPYHGFSVEFSQHREYVPGDDLRHLDWRVYGKSDRYCIKQYEEETNLRSHILLDCSGSMRYPEHDAATGRLTKFEYGATIAASLAYLLLRQQDAVGLILFDKEVRTDLPALSSRAHLQSIIHQLEQARLDAPSDVKTVFSQLAGRLRQRGLVILVSDLLADPSEIILGLQRFRHARHEVVVLHVLDHDERVFPFQDNTLFEGLEAPQSRTLVDPQSLRRGYLAAMEAYVREIRVACRNSRIDYVGLSTLDPLDVALRSYLAARKHFCRTRV